MLVRMPVCHVIGASLVLLTAMPLGAQPDDEDAPAQPDVSLRVGLGAAMAPDYPGSDDYEAIPLPDLAVRYGRFYAGVRDGIGFDALEHDAFTVGPFINYARGRDATGDIAALNTVDGGVAVGVRGSWEVDAWELSGALTAPLSGDIEGARLSMDLRYSGRIGRRWRYAVGPGLVLGTRAWTESLFGISRGESRRSGLPAFTDPGGYQAVNVGGRLNVFLTRQWAITGIAQVSRILGDAADSPIVADAGDPLQGFAGVAVGYRF